MKLGRTKEEERSRAVKYRAIGRALVETAGALDLIADAKYGNGLAIISVHAAIAYTDALTVAFRGVKSVDGDHVRAADVLEFALGPQVDASQVKLLRRILDEKSEASYGANLYSLDEGRRLLRRVEMYAAWAEGLLGDK